LLIPSLESSLAVRAYYLDCDDLEEFEHNNTNKDSAATSTNTQCGSRDDDFDNLAAFLNAFQLAVVLFIRTSSSSSSPPSSSSSDQQQREQLDRPSSLFHRAQRLVRSVTLNVDPNTVSRESERVCEYRDSCNKSMALVLTTTTRLLSSVCLLHSHYFYYDNNYYYYY
jgi:hypothetical protein